MKKIFWLFCYSEIHILFTKKNVFFIKNIKKAIEKPQKMVYNIG